MEVVKEMKIQSYAVLFGGFRVASKIPKVKLNADFPAVYQKTLFLSVGSWEISGKDDKGESPRVSK